MPRRRRRVPIEVYAARLRARPPAAEVEMKRLLKGARILDRFLFQRPLHGFIPDFHEPVVKLVLEVDGAPHATKRGFLRDRKRTAALASHGFTVFRYWNGEVMREGPEIILDITAFLEGEDADRLTRYRRRRKLD